MTVDRTIVEAARDALSRAVGAQPGERDAGRLARLTGIDPAEPLDERQLAALCAGRGVLEREAGGWRRMARTTSDPAWRAACTAQAEEAERRADEIARLMPRRGAEAGPEGHGGDEREAGEMTDECHEHTTEDDAYVMYEALIDPLDEAELLDQEAEGQPVGDVWRQRQEELRELLAEMGLGDQVAQREAER